ncbi:PTS glucose transporter subunit IIA [uncultured Enorma sp.]|uniref:PTS glucose transporter subunit IIA n=1 Tax=uncultured Enorma sp. TaxID=1714346 RepID=UPI0026DB84AD|nr:PTS glucose transporter subunit IIA [uncultured Enorma sp.]
MADPVFSSKCMGDGLCITPAPSADTVVAPADATVTVTMPASNHAVGLTLDNCMELLIHVGIDTVAMGGDGFTCSVSRATACAPGRSSSRSRRKRFARRGTRRMWPSWSRRRARRRPSPSRRISMPKRARPPW